MGTLIFPVIFSIGDALETIVSGICLDTTYGYAMAMNSVSTDPLLALYPIFVMIGGHLIMKEKVSAAQYVFLLGIVAGSVMVIAGTVL